jgi:hypothetical protein
LERPAVAALIGPATSSSAAGEVWHYFDQQLEYPITMLDSDRFGETDLEDFDVFILPAGGYGSVMSVETLETVKQWIRRGGRLIALESAVSFLAGKEGFSVKAKKESDAAKDSVDHAARRYGDRNRNGITDDVPGAVFRVGMDTTHPLAFGYGAWYYTLKRSDDVYAYLEGDNDWNVGVLPENGLMSGFVGSEALENLKEGMVIGVQAMGRGEVVYLADDPLFRGFWYGGRLLLANAVFMR